MKNGNLLSCSTFAMNAICCYCFLTLLILMNIDIIHSQPRDKQSYKQDADLPLINKRGDSDSWTPITSCHEPFFACPEGSCIPPNWMCDGENDCDAGEDEDEHFCSTKSKGSMDGEEALRPERSPTQTNESEISSHLNSTQNHLFNGSQDAQYILEKSSINKKHLEAQVFKSNKEYAKNLIRESSKTLYLDQFLNSEPQKQRPGGTKLKDSSHKNSSWIKIPKSIESSFKIKNEDESTESEEEEEERSCCAGKHSVAHHDELQTMADSNFKNLNKIDALGNITKDLLLISEMLKTFELSHNKDCIDKDYMERKKQNLISKMTCPHHFQFIISSCIYVQVYPPVSWQEASSLCQSHGGKLLTIHSTRYYENLLMQMEHDKQRSYSFWIGATNSGGLWTWVDNTPFNSLSLWGFTLRKNSKNLNLSVNHPNQCAFLDGNLLSYVNGAGCLEEKGFICKSTTH